jgi:hypothetical protein
VIADAALVAVLLWRREWRRFPVFVDLACWTLLIYGFLSYLLVTNLKAYEFVYGKAIYADYVFQFAVLLEILLRVLRPVGAGVLRGSVGLLAGLLALGGALLWVLTWVTIPPGLSPYNASLLHFLLTFSALRLVIFVLVLVFSQSLGLTWRHHVLELASGLAFYSVINTGVRLLQVHMGSDRAIVRVDTVQSIAYIATSLFWIWAFWQPEPERKEFSPQMKQLLVSLSASAKTGRTAMAHSASRFPGRHERD